MSGLPKQCCATGTLHTGIPAGREERTHGFDCYISDPPAGTAAKGIIVIIPDIFGWTLPNARILADEYAKGTNSIVYLPDFQNGAMVPANKLTSIHALFASGIIAQLYKLYHLINLLISAIPFMLTNPDGKALARIELFFTGLRNNEASHLPIGAAGFCWGGKHVITLCNDSIRTAGGKSVIDCGFTAHPSSVSIPKDVEGVVKPLALAAAEVDPQLSRAQFETFQKILDGKAAKGRESGVEHECVWYSGCFHGFAVRADESKEEERKGGEAATKQAVEWFNRRFALYEK